MLKVPIKDLNTKNPIETEFINNDTQHVLSLESFIKLIKLADHTKSDNQINILFQVLDLDQNRALSFKEFLYLPDLLNIRITEIKDRMTILEKYIPNIYNHKSSVILRNIVKHW